ncbi:acyltransferase family protein [Microbulbifer celer]|uniref:Acyltransferase family protein n=1 Tax=Microbulbifer celer TaxID=435905 RepID=A0ABW3U516_9GAMM|nr:acyltransferase [Microbulbifer celer]UFN56649.1 acyltransferase [Microbulbifer celer]
MHPVQGGAAAKSVMGAVVARLDRLDALRGIAALLVVWQHTSESFVKIPGVAERGSWLADLAWSVDFGRIGVVCFFLISGFIIPHSFSSGPGALKKFAIRRLFRLYPVYWVSILVALMAGSILANRHWEPIAVITNLSMMQKLLGQEHIQGLYWTLQVELIFYILCACLFFSGKMKNMVFLTFFAGGCLFVFVGQELLLRSIAGEESISAELRYIPYFLSIMFCGTLLRAVFWEEHPLSRKLFFLTAPAAAFGIPALVLMLHFLGFSVVDQPVRFGAAYLIALAIFLLAIFIPWRVPGILAWFGLISYSIYLFHPVAMRIVHWTNKQSWAGFTENWALWVYMSAGFAITLLIATCTFYLIERPAIAVGRRLSRRKVMTEGMAVT